MKINILICGIGGQGVVLLGNFIRQFLFKKYNNAIVSGTESRGVAQREGSVISTVRIDNSDEKSNFLGPEIPFYEADIIIALEPIELLRNLKYAHSNTIIFLNSNLILPKNMILDILEVKTEIRSEKSKKLSKRSKKYQELSNYNQILNKIAHFLSRIPQTQKYPLIGNNGNEIFKIRKNIEEIASSSTISGKKYDDEFREFDDELKVITTQIYPKLIHFDLTSLMIHEESSNLMNFIMLGFVSTLLKDVLVFSELKEFIKKFFKTPLNDFGKNKIKVNNRSLTLGKFLAIKYVESISALVKKS